MSEKIGTDGQCAWAYLKGYDNGYEAGHKNGYEAAFEEIKTTYNLQAHNLNNFDKFVKEKILLEKDK